MRCAHVARIELWRAFTSSTRAPAAARGVDHHSVLAVTSLHLLFEYASGMLLVISIRSKQTVYTHIRPLAIFGFQYCTLIHRHNQYYMQIMIQNHDFLQC